MEIIRTEEGGVVTLKVSGRMDTNTAPEAEAAVARENMGGKLVFDFNELEYISSAGLRVLLAAQKKANAAGGEMVVTGCQEAVLDVFDVTGFSDILTIEE